MPHEVYRLRWHSQEDFCCVPPCSSVLLEELSWLTKLRIWLVLSDVVGGHYQCQETNPNS